MGKESIVIIGFGWVGQANAVALSRMGYPVSYFDPADPPQYYEAYKSDYTPLKKLASPTEIDAEDVVYIVCVGDKVSEEGIQDLSLIQKALDSLSGVKGTVVLRSTILPERLKEFSYDFYLPEFLHEKQGVEDCEKPYLFVVGKNSDKPEPSFFSAWSSIARKSFSGTPEDASRIKYLSNLWNSVRIAFVNEFGTTITEPKNKEDLERIERVVDFMFDQRPYLRYGRAFGGHCLPKDTRAFVRWYKDKGFGMELLGGTYSANDAHKKVGEKNPVLPEWYSAWPDRYISGATALKSLGHSLAKRLGLSKNQ